ncbi:MAG: hypothetical protein Q7T72_10980 [Bacteroidales bacterium]|nr:hypothetical protein [Bacteroidales bacterium]
MKYNFLLVSAFYLILTSCSQRSADPVDFVNPNIGGISPLLETTVPLVNLPNSMMRIHRLPGNYQAEKINGFPFILCGHRNGTAGLLMPAAGEGIATLEGTRPSLSLTFNIPEKDKVGVKMGISFVDAEQARRNLETDIPDWNFESLKAKGRKEWNKPWFSWDDIKDGGELVLEMGSRPDYLWGSDPADTPPSKLDNQVLIKVSG